jgi:PAS domain S-box-containing protein
VDSNVKKTREDQYQSIFELLEEGYFEVDLKGNYTFVNDAVCKNYGAPRDEIIGMNYKEYMDEKTAASVYKLFNQVYKTGKPFILVEWEITKKDGAKAVEESSVYLIRNAAGKPIGFRGIVRDVTERKIMQEALRQSEERFRSILDSIEEGYFEVDLAGNIVYFNNSFSQQLGYSRDELPGMSYRHYIDRENLKEIYQAFNKVFTTGKPLKISNWTIIKKDGARRIHETSISPIKNANGERVGFRGITRDVTERKILEEEREKHITELQEALAKVKLLSGMLPICAYCKKIRNDEGYWTQIELYLQARSEAEFSHGICPDCRERITNNYRRGQELPVNEPALSDADDLNGSKE